MVNSRWLARESPWWSKVSTFAKRARSTRSGFVGYGATVDLVSRLWVQPYLRFYSTVDPQVSPNSGMTFYRGDGLSAGGPELHGIGSADVGEHVSAGRERHPIHHIVVAFLRCG